MKKSCGIKPAGHFLIRDKWARKCLQIRQKRAMEMSVGSRFGLFRNVAVAHDFLSFMGWVFAHEKWPAGNETQDSFHGIKPAGSKPVGSGIDKKLVLEQHS